VIWITLGGAAVRTFSSSNRPKGDALSCQLAARLSQRGLTGAVPVFHICSHGSRDARRGEKPWLEGAYALRQRLPAGNHINAKMRLLEAARPGDVGSYEGAELPAGGGWEGG
jgi:hypothetical protein